MSEFSETFLYKLRFLVAGIFVIASLLLLPFLLAIIWKIPTAQAQGARLDSAGDNSYTIREDSPNVITNGMFAATDEVGRAASSAEQAVSNSIRSASKSIATTTVQSGRFAVHSVRSGANQIAHAVDSSADFITHSVGSGSKFVTESAGNTVGFIANKSSVSAIIRPADKLPVPVIDTNISVSTAVQPDPPVKNTTPQPHVDLETTWPMNGAITTKFGVPHRPFQPFHTGIDISDGQRSGSTPIKPFKSGRVIETVRSKVGLGNNVVIDHGGGMTSVYAHLSSITVQVGQEVDKKAILGYAGSTGASTGTHLHFEIRINGKPVDPRLYLGGQS